MRKQAADNSSAVSLFPFIAVLLCTMGALLVILVVVTRVASEKAQQRAEARQIASAKAPADSEAQDKLVQVNKHMARLQEVREKAMRQLHDDKLLLSHLEEQMRRLVDQVGGIKAAAAELESLDDAHLDDRRQAERELERLRELITDTNKEIAAIKRGAGGKKRSYAIVPYDGPNGTNRRPIYIECRKNEVILQPEGIKLEKQDFQEPVDSGNPLASALRAAREELIRQAPVDAAGKRAEPYPLILVRPDGVETYYEVRRAIAEWDSDFGYEFVDGDWKLKFQPASPQLAVVEHQAVEHARLRRKVLAAAAPRAYRAGGGGGYPFGDGAAGDEHFGETDEAGGTGETSPHGGGLPGAGRANSASEKNAVAARSRGVSGGASGVATDPRSDPIGPQPNAADGKLAQGAGTDPSAKSSGSGNDNDRKTGGNLITQNSTLQGQSGTAPQLVASNATGPSDGPSREGSAAASGQAAHGGPTSGSADSAAGGMSAGSNPSIGGTGSPSNMTSASNPSGTVVEIAPQTVSRDLAEARGDNWALERKGAAAVPVRRSIQVIVRDDRFAILPEQAASRDASDAGREIPLSGPTSKHVDDIVAAVQQHVRGWGIAGRGLYWRPVLVVHVGPDGTNRAQELTRLLRNSGIELRSNTATAPRGQNDSPRR